MKAPLTIRLTPRAAVLCKDYRFVPIFTQRRLPTNVNGPVTRMQRGSKIEVEAREREGSVSR